MKRRVTGSSAATSEATKFSFSPRPTATHAGQDQSIRLLFTQHDQRIRAFQLSHGGTHGLEQIVQRLHVEMDAMRDDFGIGLRSEHIAARLQLGAQLFVILDDAVVDNGQTIVRHMRVRVAFARYTMRSPAGVRDAGVAGDRTALQRLLQHLHLADGATARDFTGAVDDGNTRGIVAAIFQAPEAFDEDRHDVAAGYGSYNSTHAALLRRFTLPSVKKRILP